MAEALARQPEITTTGNPTLDTIHPVAALTIARARQMEDHRRARRARRARLARLGAA